MNQLLVASLGVLLISSSSLNAQIQSRWQLGLERDPFDDSLIAVRSVIMAANGVGMLSVGCDVKKKEFIFGIITGDYGGAYTKEAEIPNNFRYRIDKNSAVISTMTHSFQGVATTSRLDSEIVKDILKGGKRLTVQTSLNDKSRFLSEFTLKDAKKVLAKIVSACE